ncbi:hypothetical protein ABZ917_46930 [Nonomuraea wenchangensis]
MNGGIDLHRRIGVGRAPLQVMTGFFVDFEERDEDYDWQAAMLAVIGRPQEQG